MNKFLPLVVVMLLLTTIVIWQVAAASNKESRFISYERTRELLASDSSVVVIDVRTREEFAGGRIPGALLLPYDEIDAKRASRIIPAKDSTVIVYCRSGRRSAIAAETLASLGYTSVWDLGGIHQWKGEIER